MQPTQAPEAAPPPIHHAAEETEESTNPRNSHISSNRRARHRHFQATLRRVSVLAQCPLSQVDRPTILFNLCGNFSLK